MEVDGGCSVPPAARRNVPRRILWRTVNGFTLVELIVAMTVLVLLVLMMVSMTTATNRVWQSSRARVDAFQAARGAFERVTSHLSQATLATYIDYYNAGGQSRTDLQRSSPGTAFTPATYDRASDLQFVCGQAAVLAPPAISASRPTHAVFFQAPLGYVSTATTANNDFKELNSVLNAVGYYIDFTNGALQQPAFITSLAPSWRYRLMELYQPSQNLTIYFPTSTYGGPQAWFTVAVNPTQTPGATATSPTIVAADNIVALIVRPETASTAASATSGTSPTEIAPGYGYDTKAYLAQMNADGTTPGPSYYLLSKNQLPPMVQVTMVAIDANSAARLANMFGINPPTLFTKSPFTDVTQYASDLASLETVLRGYQATYHVFVADVSVFGAQWTQSQ
jgi:uncharacterized protein (TIGR02599 family)